MAPAPRRSGSAGRPPPRPARPARAPRSTGTRRRSGFGGRSRSRPADRGAALLPGRTAPGRSDRRPHHACLTGSDIGGGRVLSEGASRVLAVGHHAGPGPGSGRGESGPERKGSPCPPSRRVCGSTTRASRPHSSTPR
ncbi:hypothetical protein FRACA_4020002 [Frankia canadensis]|uniref:Uncharacterized protein n=1 Tax=Frankia canadensis TaxID=1836972 RepID=A0A2I2KWS6_9ACTN|nr:hypothetical protein FRACA_4020002 [Frankia canadensis]SOU57400.1 hypothetical protein FRACA_4020002 [Frankia canadensis]